MTEQESNAAKNRQDTGELWNVLGMSEQPAFARPKARRFWQQAWFRVTVSVLIILFPILLWILSMVRTATQPDIIIAGGQEGGLHARIASGITKLHNRNHSAPVASKGSLENLRRLQVRDVDFALYQSHTARLLGGSDFTNGAVEGIARQSNQLPDYFLDREAAFRKFRSADGVVRREDFENISNVRFIANLFTEVVHLIVHSESGIQNAAQLRGKHIAIGRPESGHHAISKVLLNHLNLSENHTNLRSAGPLEVLQDWDPTNKRKIDAAFFTVGLGTSQIEDILARGNCQLLPLPRIDALCLHEVFFAPKQIPLGLYKSANGYQPKTQAIESVGVTAMLLANKNVPKRIVEKVTVSILNDEFLRTHELDDLFHLDPVARRQFAQAKPEFEIHVGARGLYNPQEFNPDAFQGWEALYSLIASAVLATVVGGRWLMRRRERMQGHRLDAYLKSLLKIELRQAAFDAVPGQDDSKQLQALLHEVTALRQQALGEFSAHQLTDDPAHYCFLEMCHYISEKINSKLLRQRLDRQFQDLKLSLENHGELPSTKQE